MSEKLNVSLTNTETFKKTIDILSEILNDERIDENLRAEYKNKSSELLLIQDKRNSNELSKRIGFIDVSFDLINQCPEGLLEVFKDILVTDVKFDINGILHYRGLSKYFDLVEEGEKPPLYKILCIRKYSNGIENRSYKYEKVKE